MSKNKRCCLFCKDGRHYVRFTKKYRQKAWVMVERKFTTKASALRLFNRLKGRGFKVTDMIEDEIM